MQRQSGGGLRGPSKRQGTTRPRAERPITRNARTAWTGEGGGGGGRGERDGAGSRRQRETRRRQRGVPFSCHENGQTTDRERHHRCGT